VRPVAPARISAAGARPLAWIFWAGLALASVLYLAEGWRLAQRMVTWTDESAYVHVGYLVASGQISLFQDELTGSRMPLPFWPLGLSQILWGRSLLVARLTALVIGLAALALTAVLARLIAGELAGILAAVFFAMQGVLVGYLATGTYHSLAASILLGASSSSSESARPGARCSAWGWCPSSSSPGRISGPSSPAFSSSSWCRHARPGSG